MAFKLPALLDGAMGTMLQRSGMKPGTIPETLNITEPETVAAIHRAYLRAGSRAVYANTFGANSLKLKNTGYSTAELIAGITPVQKISPSFFISKPWRSRHQPIYASYHAGGTSP